METLQTIAYGKEKIATENEKKKLEKELTKEKKQAQRPKKRRGHEKRLAKKEAKRLANIAETMAAQEQAKKQFKANWTTKACEQAGQRLHESIKEGGGNHNQNLYLETQPLAYKNNQEITIEKLKAKKVRNKYDTLMPRFELLLMLLYFHGIREYCLHIGYPPKFVQLSQLPPWMFCKTPPRHCASQVSSVATIRKQVGKKCPKKRQC